MYSYLILSRMYIFAIGFLSKKVAEGTYYNLIPIEIALENTLMYRRIFYKCSYIFINIV